MINSLLFTPLANTQSNQIYLLSKSLKGLRRYGTKAGFTQLTKR